MEHLSAQAFVVTLGGSIVLSIVLASRAIAVGSWRLMWAAALCLFVAILNGFYFLGAILTLILGQLVAVAAGLRWEPSARGWAVLRIIGLLVWIVVIPGQMLLILWRDWSSRYAFLIITVLWLLTPLLPIHRVLNRRHAIQTPVSPLG